MMGDKACSRPERPDSCYSLNGKFPFSFFSLAVFMARQQITSKKSLSRPRDEVVKSDRKPAPRPGLNASEADESTDDDDENSGVDDGGLEKLVKALGEDGLDEFDLAQLRMLSGAAAGEDVEDVADTESVPEDEEPGDREEEEEEEEGEEIALDDDDVDSVDQDAIPRRKVQVDNKVCLFSLFICRLGLFYE
jgi:rRNA-processing protein EBP2